MNVRRLLVGLDGSPLAESILTNVAYLATRLHADLVLLHVVPVPGPAVAMPPAYDDVIARERVAAQEYLDGVAKKLGASGTSVRSAVVVGDAALEIVRCAEREHADLIALATHGRSGLQRWVHGSVADAVLHATSTPLLLLRPSTRAPLPEVRRIMVALDGSPLAEGVLPIAELLAAGLGAPLELVRVVELVSFAFTADPYGAACIDYDAILSLLREDAERYLDGVAARGRGAGLAVETTVRYGSAVDAIVAAAHAHPGTLLVLGTHGRSGWRALALGSVARRTVLATRTPVLVVRAAPSAA